MSTRSPSNVTLSLEEFSRHGGLTGPHKDGWGVAWYEERDVHLAKESIAASSSLGMRNFQEHPMRSSLVISHIRKATQGAVATRNCQPFIRELGGVWHSFAHNGDLTGLRSGGRFSAQAYQPVGETDSEYAFCSLMERLKPVWKVGRCPALKTRLAVITEFAAELRELGPANFLYSDGETLFAHSHRRHQLDGTVRAPGLWRLERHCTEGGVFDTGGLNITAPGIEQFVVLIASVPLSNEGWKALSEGTVLAVKLGRELETE